jgi:transcription antitermination factor NusG
MIISDQETTRWWALRVTYNREMKVKHELDRLKIENFLPLTVKAVERGDRLVKNLVPAIHNLIFLRLSFKRLQAYRESSAMPVRYIMDHATGQPLWVPDRQMNSFITVASHHDQQVIYLDADGPTFTKGDHVRIIGGIFAGAEGRFVRLKGDRRVVVSIRGVAAVATTFIHPSMVEKIND